MLGIVADRFTNMWSYLADHQCYTRVGRAAIDLDPEDVPETFKDVDGSGVSLDVQLCDKAKQVYVDEWSYRIDFVKLGANNCITYTRRFWDKRTWCTYTTNPVVMFLDRIQIDRKHVKIKCHDSMGSYCLHFDIYLFLEILGISRYVLKKSDDDVKNTVVRRLSYLLNHKKSK